MTTLLAPAKNYEVACAAIQAGADAIYIGAPKFGARAAAGNTIEELTRVVNYAHLYGVQVLVTLNTLMTDAERHEAAQIAHQLYDIGVDALIIQDLRLLAEDLPPIRLHASTQCDNRTPEQVRQLRDMGFKRVVLARELSIAEITAIHQAVPDIELEAFIHGALCVSYSGRCYMSEVLLNRSANRGCCAQMCRMAYDLLDKDMHEILDDQGQPIHQRYLLSLQDMDRSLYLNELIAAGVTTFKIEGRLKDRDYVTNIVAFYRNLLGTNGHLYHYDFTPDPRKTFHRGATDYFLHGRTPHMANHLTPKSTGEYIGESLSAKGKQITIRLDQGISLHNGDGLCVGDRGFAVNNVEPLAHGLSRITANTNLDDFPCGSVYRNQDTLFLRSLHAERRIPVSILLEELPDGYRLKIGDREKCFPYDKLPATNPDKALLSIRTQLSKLGDTPYVAKEVEVRMMDDIMKFIPLSELNLWRRTLTQHL